MNELFICINSVFIHETISCLHLANKFEIHNKHNLVFSQLRFMNEKSNKTNYYSNGSMVVAYG